MTTGLHSRPNPPDGSGRDRVDLTELNIGSLETLLAITGNGAGDAVISAFFDGEESTLRLDGVGKGALKAGPLRLRGRVRRRPIDGTGRPRRPLRRRRQGHGARSRRQGPPVRRERRRYGLRRRRPRQRGRRCRARRAHGRRGGRPFSVQRRHRHRRQGRRSADRVTDFVATRDLLGLAAIDAQSRSAGNQAFTFIGDDAFDAEGQVRVTQSGGDTFISLNTTGSGGREAMIQLDGAIDVTEVDLIL